MSAVSTSVRRSFDASHTALSQDDRRQLADDVAALRAVYGSRWTRVPEHFGREATQALERLSAGVVPINPYASDPVRVVQEIKPFADETAQTATFILSEASVLSEALATDLTALPLAQLRRVCRAITRLSDAPPPNPWWAHPSEVQAATVVLAALGDDLRELANLRMRLYELFSEDIWDLDCAHRLPSIDRWWHSARRRRVRAELASVTRTGRAPTDVAGAVAMLRRASELNGGATQAWSAVSGHLGGFATAGIPDVDGATEALAGMHDLQLALGDRGDAGRLQDLAAADAFVCDELAGRASTITLSITEWAASATRIGGIDPMSNSAPQLQQWAADTEESIAVLIMLRDTTEPLRSSTRTVGAIFRDAIARDRIHQLCEVGYPAHLDPENYR
jgi:hypothetical protein